MLGGAHGQEENMRPGFRVLCLLIGALAFGVSGWGQSSTSSTVADGAKTHSHKAKSSGAGKQMRNGGKDVGVGVAKGTGDLAKGTAGGVGNLARGNFAGAGSSFGKGAAGM